METRAERFTAPEQQSLDFTSRRNFVLQQGFELKSGDLCPAQYSALRFQPKVVTVGVLAGLVLQSAVLFFALGLVLWWSAAVPRLNPFDIFYNNTFGRREGAKRLEPARPPRRFSQFLGGTFAVTTGLLLVFNWFTAAYVVEALFGIAVAALAFGRFCLGSFIYLLLTGRGKFASATLPWARSKSDSPHETAV